MTTTTHNENNKTCVKCGNQKHGQYRFPILIMLTENDKPIIDGDQKCTNEKVTHKANEGCSLMDIVVPKHEPFQHIGLSLKTTHL